MAKAAPFVGARNRRVLLIVVGVVVGLGALLMLASVVEHVWYSGAVLPGVHIDGTQIGGKNDAAARAEIERLSAQTTKTLQHFKGAGYVSANRRPYFDRDWFRVQPRGDCLSFASICHPFDF